jgi:hypothetical protein
MALRCTGQKCQLPENTTVVTQDGMTYQLQAPGELTGVPDIDRVIRAHSCPEPGGTWWSPERDTNTGFRSEIS